MKKSLHIFWISLGFLCLGLGTLGICIPVLPTVPFYMATVFCFAKGSERLHRWFLGTGLYKKHLESFTKNKEMTLKAKLSVISTVTLLMAFDFYIMHNVPVGRICLIMVWLAHMFYFALRIKTVKERS